MAAAIMGNAAIAARRQEEHLVFKGIRAERPIMAEDNRLSLTQIIVINLRAIFGRDRGHGVPSFVVARRIRSARALNVGSDPTSSARLPAGTAIHTKIDF
jgi:hypothetical protein